MDSDPLALVRTQIGQRIAELQAAGPRLSPLDVHSRLDAIRAIAAAHGLQALEALACCSAQFALLPGHRTSVRSCLDHIEDALDSRSAGDSTAILAAVAVRLH